MRSPESATTQGTNRLALEGGAPVRTRPLPRCFIGSNEIGEEEKRLVNEVLDTRTLYRFYGPGTPHVVQDFEREFREEIGVRYALAVSSGSAACFCAMRALGVGPGDEVIVPAFGWIPDYSMVDHLGATPVFAAIDESLNLSPEDFESRITPRTRAVVLIYYQGGAVRVDEIVAIARRHNLLVLEDVAQAPGAAYKGRKLGAWGDIACFSLQANKVITSGDGGVVATNNQEFYELCVRYHDLGQLRDPFKPNLEGRILTEPISGYQWRMSELTGAVALAQLRKLPRIIEACRTRATRLRARLTESVAGLRFRAVDPESDLGILVAFDLGTQENVAFFARAFAAEGVHYGPTSWCETLRDNPSVGARLAQNGIYTPETFDRTTAMSERFAKLAIVPAYSLADVDDMAEAAVKILLAMRERGMIG